MFVLTCIPAYNEEEVIGKVVKESLRYSDSVVVCDDGSSDMTAKNAKDAGAFIITHQINQGKGAAMKSLFDFARHSNADIIVTIDGDGQFLPEEIPKLLQPIREQDFDIVIGNRFHSKNSIPKYRKVGNKMLDKVTNIASSLPFKDTQSGFRSYSKNAVMRIEFDTIGFGVDSEILINASKNDLKISEENVTVLYDIGTKTSTKNPVSHSGSVIASLIEKIAIVHPLKYLALPGVILLLIGIAFAISVITTFNDYRYFSIPSTVISVGFLVIGTMLTLISVLLYSMTKLVKH